MAQDVSGLFISLPWPGGRGGNGGRAKPAAVTQRGSVSLCQFEKFLLPHLAASPVFLLLAPGYREQRQVLREAYAAFLAIPLSRYHPAELREINPANRLGRHPGKRCPVASLGE